MHTQDEKHYKTDISDIKHVIPLIALQDGIKATPNRTAGIEYAIQNVQKVFQKQGTAGRFFSEAFARENYDIFVEGIETFKQAKLNALQLKQAIIFHAPENLFGIAAYSKDPLKFVQDNFMDYKVVASVIVKKDNSSKMLEQAFSNTNSIDAPWLQNENIISSLHGCRSTSVGDLIMIDDDIHMVDSFGFKPLGNLANIQREEESILPKIDMDTDFTDAKKIKL